MRFFITLLLVIGFWGVVSCSSPNYDTSQNNRPATSAEKAFSNGVFAGINRERAKRGLTQLKRRSLLDTESQRHSRFLSANPGQRSRLGGRLAHHNFVFRSYKARSLGFTQVGEIVMTGSETGDRVEKTIDAWMNSKRHRKQILTKLYTDIGVGSTLSSGNRLYSAVLFGGVGEELTPIRSTF